jgi:ADP-heptose:LPS heptosyltransferase
MFELQAFEADSGRITYSSHTGSTMKGHVPNRRCLMDDTDLQAGRVLIFLLGSLGDTLVALPALHLVARRFSGAERRILTHFSIGDKAAPMEALLNGSNLIHGYFRFPAMSSKPTDMLRLVAAIRRWQPDVLIHLHEPGGKRRAWRDLAFFRACGIRRMIGLPLSDDWQEYRFLPESKCYEHRAEQIARRVAALGDSRLDSPDSWSLGLTATETANGATQLSPVRGCDGILAMSIGCKMDVNDWGDSNWAELLRVLSARLGGWGLAAFGAPVERARTEALLSYWQGPRVNFCGRFSARESAAVLRRCTAYVGHDSGPMHLAASVGLPGVGIYSSTNPPGRWFPYGKEHTVIYKRVPCSPCGLTVCKVHNKQCILSITVTEVEAAVLAIARAAGRDASPRVGLRLVR